jgi:hypothetical protein
MSEPIRFSLKHHGQLSCVEHCPEGEYVLHADYACLKAEVERLDTLCKQVMAQHSDISCENIMLRKAGDAMVGLLEHMDVIVDMDSDHPEVEAWLAAKEGKLRA